MNQQSHLQIYEMFTSLFVTISKGEQIIDGIKQILTTHDLFHPLTLFKYLTKNNPFLVRKNILSFLEENNVSATDQEIRILFGFQGVKERMSYTTFLNMVYPFSMSANRQISASHLKNYHQTQHLNVQEQILASFFLLITQQINLINRIEIQKQDSFASIPKDKIHKVLQNIKKLSEKSSIHCEKNPNVITGIQLIYFVKNFTSIDENTLLYLIRRLGTDHLGSIQIQKLQAFVKPWKKKKIATINDKQNIPEQLQQQESSNTFNQEKYRNELNSQLSKTFNNEKQGFSKRKNRKQGAIKIKQGQKMSKVQSSKPTSILKSSALQSKLYTPTKSVNQTKNNQKQHRTPHRSGNNVKLFIKFISVFLKNSSQIQQLRGQLAKNSSQINYLKIFKSIDVTERGVITCQQLQKFYSQIGGVNVSMNFGILVGAFSQTAENWLSYSQFCEIFRPSVQKTDRANVNGGNEYASRLTLQNLNMKLSQILYLTLVNEHQLLQIRRQFTKDQLFHLFSLINKEKTGYINYQQLKHFLKQISLSDLNMYELMLILKRLDKCKNGVVSQNQFVDYFLVRM